MLQSEVFVHLEYFCLFSVFANYELGILLSVLFGAAGWQRKLGHARARLLVA